MHGLFIFVTLYSISIEKPKTMNVESLRRRNHELRFKANISNLLISCGIEPDKVNPRLLGKGGNHKVYRFKNGEQIVKIPINPHIGTVGSAEEEKNNIDLYLQYFPNFSVPTYFLESSVGCCVVMDYVKGRLMTKDDVFEIDSTGSKRLTPVGEQLGTIIQANKRLIDEKGKMIDLVGLEGLIGAVRSLGSNSKPAQLTNVRIKDGKLRIVDYDLVSLRNFKRPLAKTQAIFVFQLNQQVLSHHFKLDYARKR